jgi:uncharacterized protein (DUF2141 family)
MLFHLLVFLTQFLLTPPNSHTLTIKVDGIEEVQGKLMFKLSDASGKVIKKFTHPVNEKLESLKLELPTGTYALACFHDANDNDELDSGFTGIPTENYAFSNNVRGTFGPPDLADQLFTLQVAKTIQLHLK